jgi:predicted DNA-binding transcriptional regulator AlpA
MLKLPNDLPQESSIPASQTPPSTLKLVLDGFLRREELAQQLDLSPRTIDRWEALRKGPPRVCVGRTVLYNVESVREWLKSQERQFSRGTRPDPRRDQSQRIGRTRN